MKPVKLSFTFQKRMKNKNVAIKQAFDELKWFANPFKFI